MHPPCVTLLASLVATSLMGPLCSNAVADDFPVLKPGLWEYQRTGAAKSAQGQTTPETVRQCTSPSDDIRKRWAKLASGDCTFSPIKHTDDRYAYTSVCRHNDLVFQMASVITVENDSAYRIRTELFSAGGSSKEIVVARRQGDCTLPNSETEGRARIRASESLPTP